MEVLEEVEEEEKIFFLGSENTATTFAHRDKIQLKSLAA